MSGTQTVQIVPGLASLLASLVGPPRPWAECMRKDKSTRSRAQDAYAERLAIPVVAAAPGHTVLEWEIEVPQGSYAWQENVETKLRVTERHAIVAWRVPAYDAPEPVCLTLPLQPGHQRAIQDPQGRVIYGQVFEDEAAWATFVLSQHWLEALTEREEMDQAGILEDALDVAEATAWTMRGSA